MTVGNRTSLMACRVAADMQDCRSSPGRQLLRDLAHLYCIDTSIVSPSQGKCSLYDNFRIRQKTEVSQLLLLTTGICVIQHSLSQIGILFVAAAPWEAVNQFGISLPLEEDTHSLPPLHHLPCSWLSVAAAYFV